MIRIAGLALVVLGWCGAAHAEGFVATACDLPGVPPALASRLVCGTVAVPRDGVDPAAGTFRLAVVVIKTASPRRQDDPVVYIAGGPGSRLTIKAALLASHEAAVVAPDRDLVLVDQRGAGRSEPALCPGLAARQLQIFARGAEQATLVAQWRESFADCRREMAAAGLQPAWFGTRLTAGDIDRVREALGIERWSVYALSYGTEVATTMLALQPHGLRAVVLDSVLLPEPVPLTLPQTFGHALDALFAACEGQTSCRAAHPDLRTRYAEAVRELDAAPLTVTLARGVVPETMALRGELFRLVVDVSLYTRGGMAGLPAFIDAARHRESGALAGLLSTAVRTYAETSVADPAAVECGERPSWHDSVPSDEAPVSAYVPGMCAGWAPIGPPPLLAPNTDVPVLILSGLVDPITPPAFAHLAAAALGPRARVVEFPHVGHGAQQATPCGEAIVTAFVADPVARLGTECTAAIAPVAFR